EEPVKEAAKGSPKEAPKEAPKPVPKETPKEAPQEVKGPAPVAGPTTETKEEEEETRSSPLVRRIAKEHNVDLSALSGKGTGINGRITKSDILSYVEQGGKSVGAPAAPKTERAAPQPS